MRQSRIPAFPERPGGLMCVCSSECLLSSPA
ncbi:hypothetical protein B571_24880 [Salmonella enterica subsp. enterica serovar Typhimurium str. STm1]|nr:hypothetical protein SE451236_19230 [Salmonella enterica subsp. enterica serovar 4,[5],12:i:- str. 08-1736]EQM36016.1 hypothetical protein B571_24880 [Salmonella enterica subsp. enterica serovar Typhimurium str. STm1]EQM55667.1 hypothetical protein B577_25025 [Salmonella enterica subsp. enterica serovar Typhimurium str. STm9]EQM56797.1 hypothetical protein B574_25385 [Salmonella enterica subsp. enterica serovar Typhimurium str. STm4]EQM58626.1 hypothetical protein B579_24680 [Salmonella ente